MRVLLVAPVAPPSGGMALQAEQLAKLLRREGVRVDVFASNFALPVALRPLQPVPLVRTCLRGLLIAFMLIPRVRHADVIHILAASGLYFFLVVYPAVLVGRAFGTRVVVNYRGGAAEPFFRRWGGLVARAFKLATVITTPSLFLATIIRNRFGVAVSIVPNVLDASAFEYRQRLVFQPRLLVTRQLETIYDVASVIEAFAEIQRRHSDASLWIAGSGSEEERLRNLVSDRKLRNVRFLGQLAHGQLPAVYKDCDIYINASRVDNYPGSLLEASAAGLAVVSTKPGGIPYVYENGRTAILVDVGDWQQLAHGVERILTSASSAAAMTRAAAEIVRASDWVEVRKALFATYGVSPDGLSTPSAGLKGARCVAG
jgi:glycosyltransferase involved in cell wall biosynthesis